MALFTRYTYQDLNEFRKSHGLYQDGVVLGADTRSTGGTIVCLVKLCAAFALILICVFD